MEYIRHLTENGDWAFSNVKSVGQLSRLTTRNRQDLVSAINEINQYFSLNESSLQDLIQSFETINGTIEGLTDLVYLEQQRLTQQEENLQLRIGEVVGSLQNTENNLNDKIVESEGKILDLNNKAEQIQADLAEGYEVLDGKIVKVGNDLVNTNTELSSKMSKTEYDDNVGVDNWVASFYDVIGGFSTKYPKVEDFISLQASSVEEIKDSVMLYPFNTAKTGILHLFTNIRQNVEQTVSLSIEHTDGMAVLLNGGYIYYQAGTKVADVSISLRAGWNTVEILLGVDNKVGRIASNAKLSDLVYKMTSKIGVGNKNDTRLTQAETLIKQTNDSILLKADKTVVESLGNQITDNVAQIQINADAIESKVSKDDFNKYTGRLESAETKITQTAESIKSLATKTELDTLNGTIVDQQTSINQMAESIELKAGREELDSLSGKVTTAEASIKTNSDAIALKAEKSDLDKATGEISNVKSQLTVQAGQIGSKVSQIEFNEAVERIGTAETAITQTAQSITLKADKTEVNSVAKRVSSTESTLEVQADQIASKVSQSEFNPIKDRIVTMETAITQTNDTIELKASKSEVQEAVDNIQIGGRNLIQIEKWKRNVATITLKREGYLLNLNQSGEPSTEGIYVVPSDIINLEASTQYTLSYKIKKVSGELSYIGGHMDASFRNGFAKILIDGKSKEEWVYNTSNYYEPLNDGEWHSIEATVITAPTIVDSDRLYIQPNRIKSIAVGVQIKDVQFEKGNKATDWSPAPEDVESRISSVESSITQTAESINLNVSSVEKSIDDYKTVTGTRKDWDLAVKNITTTGWYRIAKNGSSVSTGNRAMAEFQINDTTSGKHATAIFNAGIMYGNSESLTLTGFSLYANNPFPKARIVKKSTYDQPYLEIYVVAPANISVYCRKNTQTTGWDKVNFTQGAIPTGYTAKEYTLDRNSVTDITAENTSKDTANVSGVPSATVINRISTAETEIKQTKDAIALRATKTEVTNAVNNIQIGGRNLARYTNVNGYISAYGSSKISNHDIGDGTGRVYHRATATGTATWGLEQTTSSRLMELINGEEYVVSFKARASKTGFLLNYVYIMNSGGTNQSITHAIKDSEMALGTEWKQYSFRFNFSKPDGTKSSVMISSQSTHVVNDWFDIKDIKVEKGNKATDWSPAPEDVQLEINDVKNRVTTTESELKIQADKISSKVETSDVNALIKSNSKIKDTRNDNQLPSWYFTNYPMQTVEEFKFVNKMNLTSSYADSSTYGILTTNVRWTDKSGGRIKQTFRTDVATYEREGNDAGTAWLSWKKMVDQAAMGTYVTQTLNSWGVDIVRNGNIVSKINASTEGVKIKGDKIEIEGTTVFTSLNNKVNTIQNSIDNQYGYKYYKKIIVYGDSTSTYYPVVIKGGDQTVKRDIMIKRTYGEQAPNNWHTGSNASTHKGGLTVRIRTNFGGWGGAGYSWDIAELEESYSKTFAGASFCGNNVMFAVFLRGGGTTGASYHIYSDQPLDTAVSNTLDDGTKLPSPQIAYKKDQIFQSGTAKAYAPAPRTYTTSVEEEIRTKKYVELAQEADSTAQTANTKLVSWSHPTDTTTINGGKIYTDSITANQIAANAITANEIKAGSITASEIASNAITSAKIHADAINGKTITGATIRTSATANTTGGVVINSSGIFGYNSSGTQKVKIGATGILEATDAILSGRITASADSTFAGSISTGKDITVGENIYMTYNYANRFEQKGIYFYHDTTTTTPSHESKIIGTYLKIDIINKNNVNVVTPVFNVNATSTRFSGEVNFNNTSNYALLVNNAKAKFAKGADFTGGTVNFTGATVTGFTPSFG